VEEVASQEVTDEEVSTRWFRYEEEV